MSDHDRGAYTPPTDAPLSFDARQPVRGSRPLPFTMIISVLVLAALVVAIFVFYRSGVREAGQPPQTVGQPVGELKSAAPNEAQPQDPAAGLQIYRSEAGQPAEAVPAAPTFTAPPEQPQPRPAPVVTAPPPAAAPTAVVGAAQPLRPAAPPTAAQPAPAPVAKAAPPAMTPPPAPKAAAAPTPASPVAKAASGSAAVQIGAFSSPALADKGWNDAAGVAPGLAAGKGKSVEKVERDGSTFYRTTVTGFANRTDANAFCSALKAAGKQCFVR